MEPLRRLGRGCVLREDTLLVVTAMEVEIEGLGVVGVEVVDEEDEEVVVVMVVETVD